jgi:hypothetical protein
MPFAFVERLGQRHGVTAGVGIRLQKYLLADWGLLLDRENALEVFQKNAGSEVPWKVEKKINVGSELKALIFILPPASRDGYSLKELFSVWLTIKGYACLSVMSIIHLF